MATVTVVGIMGVLPLAASSGFLPLVGSIARGPVIGTMTPLPQVSNSGFQPIMGSVAVGMKLGGGGGGGGGSTVGYPI